MAAKKIDFVIYHRASHENSIAERHASLCSNMMDVPPPFGWKGLPIPPVPGCGEDLSAEFDLDYPLRPIKCKVSYVFRGPAYVFENKKVYDDKLRFFVRPLSSQFDYAGALKNSLPEAIKAFNAYLLLVYFDYHVVAYQRLHASEYDRVVSGNEIDIDGRNNIFTLTPAQYWDAELCQKALGYGPEEVIRRLDGKVPLVKPLMGGVYTVFNDDPDLSFEEFCAINDRFKPILGLA